MFKLITLLFLILLILRAFGKYISPLLNVNNAADERMRQMQQQIRDMHEKMEQNNNKPRRKWFRKDGDYIDYEEVK